MSKNPIRSAAMKGNDHAKKLRDPEIREEAYRSYCEHIASGKSKEGWWFEHPDLTLTWETMESYIKNEPSVFSAIKKQVAVCKSFSVWEEKGHKMLSGESKSETALYQLFMRNKFGWDKEEKSKADSSKEFDQQLEIIRPINPSQKV